MYRKLPEFKRYTTEEVLFVTGLSTIIFLTGCIFVGHGVYVYERIGPDRSIDVHIVKFWPVELIYNFFGVDYIRAVWIGWIIGVICIVAGLLGFSSVIRWATFKLLKRRR